jgi:uncharacterized protein YqeY
MLQEKIKDQLKEAMFSKDEVRLSVIRSLMTSFINELVAKGKKPTDSLTDDEVMTLISRAVKQRKDSIEQFNKGNRGDLAASEQKELDILSAYLPEQMSEDEVIKIVVNKKAELNIADKSQMGNLMKAVMAELKGKADGSIVKKAVDNSFN